MLKRFTKTLENVNKISQLLCSFMETLKSDTGVIFNQAVYFPRNFSLKHFTRFFGCCFQSKKKDFFFNFFFLNKARILFIFNQVKPYIKKKKPLRTISQSISKVYKRFKFFFFGCCCYCPLCKCLKLNIVTVIMTLLN